MPLPRQSVISSRACSSTSSGSAAGPGAKLNTRTQRPLTSCWSQRTDLVAAAVIQPPALAARGAVGTRVVAFAVDRGAIVARFQSGHAFHAGQALRLSESNQAHALGIAPDHRDIGHRRAYQGAGRADQHQLIPALH